VRLRDAILEVLKQHPEFEPVVNDIALKLDLTDLADGLRDSPVRREQNEIARRERTLANLQERARALIERHRAVVKDIFEPFGLITALPEPSAGAAPTFIAGAGLTMSSGSARVDVTVLEPQGLKDSIPSPRAKTAPKRGAGARPKTKVGRAVLANSDSIVLSAQAAISVIEITIENLRAQRDNDPEAPSNMAITRLEPVIEELRNIQTLVEGFREDKVPETKLPGAFDQFRQAFAAFWEKDGDKLIG
jgi:hypothetical protein